MSAYQCVIDALQSNGSRQSGTSWQCPVPAHDDRTASLSVTDKGGMPLVNCQAGCDSQDVLAALDLTWKGLYAMEKGDERPTTEWVAQYEYTDERGAVQFVKERGEPKTFRIFKPLTSGRRQFKDIFGGDRPPRRVLYRLAAVHAAIEQGRTIFVVEGEKDVHSAESTGAIATCNYEGAAKSDQRPKWRPEYGDNLKGAHVTIVADNDAAGYAHAAAIYADLRTKAASVRIVRGLVDAEKADLTDHLRAGHGLDDLVEVALPDSHPTNPRTVEPSHHENRNRGSGISGMPTQQPAWEEPVSLDARHLPPFPVETLGTLAPFVTATAEALQVPADMVAFACLATISTTTGGRRKVMVKHNWYEVPALYLTCLADSSEKKTPALNAACDPLREIETELIEAARPEVEELAQEIRITTAAMDKAEKAAGNSKDRAAATADAEAARLKLLELGEAPAVPLILVRDITLEALAMRMAAQKGRLGSLASEGGLFKIAAGLYGNNGKANTDLLLEGYTGGPYSIERVGRPDLRMPSTFLALGMIIQPGMVAGLEKQNPEFRQSGFLGRFLYSKPAPTAYDTFDTPEVPFQVSDEYGRRIRALVEKVWNTKDIVMMRLSDDARKVFGEFYDKFAQRRKPGGDLHDIADWAGKLRGQLVRIATCITLYEDPGAPEISLDRIQAAIAMTPYFISHARAVFDLMGKNREGVLKPLRDVLAWLRSRDVPGADFSARDAWQALKGREWAEDMDAMNDALNNLEKHGWIAPAPQADKAGKPGRKPSPRYEVHPWVASPPRPRDEDSGSHPVNPRNPIHSHSSDDRPSSGISGARIDHTDLGPNAGPCDHCGGATIRRGPYANPLCASCRAAA